MKLRTGELVTGVSARRLKVGLGRRGLWKTICVVFVFCAGAAISSHATITFKTLVSFDGTDGAVPYTSLVQGLDGELFGTTSVYGDGGYGTVFKVTTGGVVTAIYSFSGADGSAPVGVVQATNGDLYGSTFSGGANDAGTLFKITAGGKLTTLYNFDLTDGDGPTVLVQASNGKFYGATYQGGANGSGTIFKITAGGTLTTLHNFDYTDGATPYPLAGLIQANNGDLYGTTSSGGTVGLGTVFKITPGGTLTTLNSFGGTDTGSPYAGLVQAANGDFYGTTYGGGANNDGTVFKITPGGTLTTLHSFNVNDGQYPLCGLIQATDGNLYGTTTQGGANGYGTVFEITSGGKLTTLHDFDSTDGANPHGGLVQATDGNLYGTAELGGANDDGTIFSLSVGLGPFVQTLTASGKVGAPVLILGTNLTGASSVSFNGTAATFTVVSKSEIKTTVPSGATTGFVTVTTPGGTWKSNKTFQVKP
ncbi:MAG: choice-of-anchor tandem repeat GloVer-containing protein [Terriglobales bacterium]